MRTSGPVSLRSPFPSRRPGRSTAISGAPGLVAWLVIVVAAVGCGGGESAEPAPAAVPPAASPTAPTTAGDADAPFDDAYGRESRAALGAHHLCSGLWVVGRALQRTPGEVLAQDIEPFEPFGWEPDFDWEVDEEARRVSVTAPDLPTRTAVYSGDQGCTILPRDATSVYFEPVAVPRDLPPAAEQDWPTGDRGATAPPPQGVDADGVAAAIDWAMGQENQNTRAIVVVHAGKIVGERYADGWSADVPQISWSQGKSITAALIGVLVQQEELTPENPAPVAAWRQAGDPRGAIRVIDLLRMSSGLDFANLGLSGPDSYTRANEHMRIYFDGLDVFEHAIEQPQEVPPNTVWRYRNSDPLTLGYVVRQTVEARGEEYLTFPQRALFDRIGARTFVLETDAWGNFILTGYDWGGARDWARFGLLHLWDGVWEGERILPEGWSELVSTPAPADENRGYGGLFWLNAGGAMDRVPEDAFWAAGFMGQTTMIVPSRDLVVVRLGPSAGGAGRVFNELVGRVIEALSQGA